MSFGNVKKQEIASGPAPGKGLSLDSLGDRMLAMNEMKSDGSQFGLPPEDSGLAVGAESGQVIEAEAAAVIEGQVIEGQVIEGETIEADEGAAAAIPERRRYERATVLWTSRILFDDKAVDCVIINISAEGAMVQVSENLEVGDSAIIKNERIGAFAGKVVWKTETQIGLSFFDDPAEIALALGRVLT